MKLSDMFKKKNDQETEPRAPGNPTTMVMFRILAIGYVLWILKDLVEAYLAGGDEAPSLVLLLGAIIVLGGGCAFVGVMTYRQWKAMKKAYDSYNDEVAAQYAAEEAANAEALEDEDPCDDEDMLELPEAEEEYSETED